MIRMALIAAAALGGLMASANAGQWTWGVGVGFGGPVYYGPPPVYYGPPVIVRRLPEPPRGAVMVPPPVYEALPAQPYEVVPAPGPLAADEIFDMLEDAGYFDFGPLALRGRLYKVTAVDPGGNLVELRLSPMTGAIRSARVIEARAAPRVIAPPPPAPAVAMSPPPLPVAAPPRPAVAAAAPPPEPAAAAPAGPPPASLRERLPGAPAEQEQDADEGSHDPLVVY